MKKPKLQTSEFYNYAEVISFIEKKHNINTRDYAHSDIQFNEWCDSKGYGQKDTAGQDRGASQIWFAEFQREITDGLVFERPYQDFWHWLVDAFSVSRGGVLALSNEDLELADEPWQSEILKLILEEFGEGEKRAVKLLTDW